MDEEEDVRPRRIKPGARFLSGLRSLQRWLVFLKSKIPFLREIHVNFIFLHYVYILSWIIIGSVIVYPSANLRYIDALFFAAGAATQSGLNPVDFNLLRTYQQVILYIISMFTTPIFINSCVVFFRLYWFEKRFENVVREAKETRRSRARTFTFTSKDERDVDREERGIGGRPIVVLRDEAGEARGRGLNHPVAKTSDNGNSESETESPSGRSAADPIDHEKHSSDFPHRFGLGNLRVPVQLSPEHHIAFLEKQRKNRGALRIPSPREYDRGGGPQTLEDEEDSITRTDTHQSRSANGSDVTDTISPLDNQHVMFTEPDMSRTRTRGTTIPRTETRASWRDNFTRPWHRVRPLHTIRKSLTGERDRTTLPYLSWNATVGRNSRFFDLTEEQRNELGGIEYRALKTLAVVLISYYLFFHIFGIIGLVGWIMCNSKWGSVVTQDGQGRPWWGVFMSQSAFNDVGFTLTPDSMNSFQNAVWPLLLMAFLIIIGNTGFPCMLRLIIWVLSKLVRSGSALWEELRFLLDHPRRCFTLLFPRNATWWLFAILIILNGTDLILFIILDLNDEAVIGLPPGYRVLDGFFQAASTRTGGFAVVNLADLHPAVQVSYLIMMYISVFPIAISLRRTNVYEERSLGIYHDDSADETEEPNTARTYIGTHLRKQLSFDLWYVFLGLFIIAIAEGGPLRDTNKPAFELFSVLFEVISAYGTVGLSLGYPNSNASFSAQFNVIGKLVIIAMQIRGRHRGLPYALDRAILLPSESLHHEMSEADKKPYRKQSTASDISRRQSNAQNQPDAGISTGMDVQDHALPSAINNREPILRRQSTLRG